ncbi:ester cyclase [Microbulbifer sp. 2304DJ12-6]|uniref:ester cyclase n=1 Tax=Microbulbifer sp. 2304DJ12-6 TaxID=3233340 RepID=UPI0039AF6831
MHKEQVRRFYEEIWNMNNKAIISSVLLESFTFRGSLGQETQGYRGFLEYVDSVHNALGDYRCTINEIVSEGKQVFAKVTFCGIHRGELMGFFPTQHIVSWVGCALFTFQGNRISDAWILGDLQGLETQLRRNAQKLVAKQGSGL